MKFLCALLVSIFVVGCLYAFVWLLAFITAVFGAGWALFVFLVGLFTLVIICSDEF